MKLHEHLRQAVTDEERERYQTALPTLDSYQLGVLLLLGELIEAVQVFTDQFVRFETAEPAAEPKKKEPKK